MVAEKTAEIAKIAASLEASEGKAAQFQFMTSELEKQKVDLQIRLDRRNAKNSSLETQLNKAFQDFQNLNAELTAVRTESERRAESERLLRGLLDERQQERDQLALIRRSWKQSRRHLQSSYHCFEDLSKKRMKSAIRVSHKPKCARRNCRNSWRKPQQPSSR